MKDRAKHRRKLQSDTFVDVARTRVKEPGVSLDEIKGQRAVEVGTGRRTREKEVNASEGETELERGREDGRSLTPSPWD